MSRYRNTGSSRLVFHDVGYAPGKTFEVDLDPVHEQRLIEGGHITKLADKGEKKQSATVAGEKPAAEEE